MAKKKEKTRDFLEDALKRAKKLLKPADYAMLHQAAMSSAGGKATARARAEAKEKAKADAEKTLKAVFVCDEPSSLEAARGDGLVGPDGVVFVDKYLGPMGLTREDIYIVFDPDPGMLDEMPVPVFTLGKAARENAASHADVCFPHPTAIRHKGDSGEVGRKVKKARSLLDRGATVRKNELCSRFASQASTETQAAESQSSAENLIKSKVLKALEQKQIVYGVVLDPYQFDKQGDWIPPESVENTAHDFMKFGSEIWFDHRGHTTARILETWLQPYPTPEDRENAFANKPHSVLLTPFGKDKVHSGSWVIGAQLSNELWALFQAGEIDAFSIGGAGVREPAEVGDMPEIKIIEVSHGET